MSTYAAWVTLDDDLLLAAAYPDKVRDDHWAMLTRQCAAAHPDGQEHRRLMQRIITGVGIDDRLTWAWPWQHPGRETNATLMTMYWSD